MGFVHQRSAVIEMACSRRGNARHRQSALSVTISMNYFELAAVLLAVFVFNLRAQPRYPATVADIEADGGRWVKQADGRLIEYFRCGRLGGTPLYFQHGYGFTGKLIFALPG